MTELVIYHGRCYKRANHVLEAMPNAGSRTAKIMTSNRSQLGRAGMREARMFRTKAGNIVEAMAR